MNGAAVPFQNGLLRKFGTPVTGISALSSRGAGIDSAPKFGDLKGRSALRSCAVAYSGEIVNGPFYWELSLPIGLVGELRLRRC